MRVVENEINESVLIQIEPVDRPHRTVTADVEVLPGGIELAVGKVFVRLLDECLRGQVRQEKDKSKTRESAAPATCFLIHGAWSTLLDSLGPGRS